MNAGVGRDESAVGQSVPAVYWRLFVRFWWVAILVVLVVLAILGGRTTGSVGAAAASRPATSSPIVVTATPARASAAAVATPSEAEKNAWYLYQQTHEGDYCQCSSGK